MANKYQTKPDPRLTKPGFGQSPLASVTVTGQGTVSKPVPPARPTFKRSLKPAPKPANAPGYSGTI